MREDELVLRAAAVAAEKKASRVRVLDLRRITSYMDYFVLCTAGNAVHMETIADGVCQAMRQGGFQLRHREGERESGWTVLDFGPLIVHVFLRETREFYDLDFRWNDARVIFESMEGEDVDG